MRVLPIWFAVLALGGCAASVPEDGGAGPAPLRGFGVEVEQAIAPRVPLIRVRTCGTWGCHEQDVPLNIAGPTSAGPCPTAAAPDTACSVAQLPGPGPGFGYAPVPQLTMDEVTVTVSTPAGAPLRISAEVVVHPVAVGKVPQARLRIAADRTVSQSG